MSEVRPETQTVDCRLGLSTVTADCRLPTNDCA